MFFSSLKTFFFYFLVNSSPFKISLKMYGKIKVDMSTDLSHVVMHFKGKKVSCCYNNEAY